MAKKRTTEEVELLPPVPQLADVKQLITEAVEKKVSEIISSAGADFEPWFQSQKITHEIRRRQTVIEQRKWTYFYDDWGCVVCGTTDRPHLGHGMCSTCAMRVTRRLASAMRKREKAHEDGDHGFNDAVRLARQALAGQLPSLPAKSSYTTAEVAAKIGVSRHALREWIKRAKIDAPEPVRFDRRSTRRLWTDADVERVREYAKQTKARIR